MAVRPAFANLHTAGKALPAKLPISPLFGPETSRTGVRGHREQFCHLSSAEVEVDCFYFLMSEEGLEDA
ncbi:hypothetical protein, partial [Mesorhizobium sp. M7A.F.Ca.US.010.02.1.1]|uniref:hypothetical protein n=1 Tax=Mesorhizobium sp. M7A.F.Ca.US.010.02.1.1 TaxID=2496743 RepID=UPI0019D49501